MSLQEKKTQALSTNVMRQDAGKGVEGADKDSYAIPFLVIVQSTSDAILEAHKDAKPGQIFNTVTEELFDEVLVVPVAFSRRFNEWVPRDEGGGFRGQHAVSAVKEMEKEKKIFRNEDGPGYITADGNQLVDTRQHFVLQVSEDGSWSPAMISMNRTQVRRSKQWMAKIQSFTIEDEEGRFNPPSWARFYALSTEKQKNDQGTWFAWIIRGGDVVEDASLYEFAKNFNEDISEGKVEVQYEEAEEKSEDDDKF